jgi:hypothetical protein
MQKLKISEAIPSLPLCAFMACAGTVSVTFYFSKDILPRGILSTVIAFSRRTWENHENCLYGAYSD